MQAAGSASGLLYHLGRERQRQIPKRRKGYNQPDDTLLDMEAFLDRCALWLQAFINTARKIYEKIEQGVFDVSNEVRPCL